MSQTHHLSQAAHDRLRDELEELRTVGRIEIARKIETAREMGDLSENGDYHAAKEEQGKMEARIGHLTALLAAAEIVEAEGSDTVVAGSVVTVTYEGDDEEETYLVGSIEEKRDNLTVVSPTSPMGAALLGKKAGETAEYDVNGRRMAVIVEAIGS